MSEITAAMVQCFLTMLKPSSVMKRTYWLDVGRALYNLHSGTSEGLKEWQAFYAKDSSFRKKCTAEMYSSFKDTFITVKTIQWYARQDSPVEYAALLTDRLMPHMDRLYPDGYKVLIPVLSILYELDIVWCEDTWFHYTNQLWTRVDQAALLQILKDDFAIQAPKLKLINESVDLHARDNYPSWMAHALEGAKAILNQPLFKTRLDSQTHILAFNNGTTDSTEGVIFFRPSKPEDYCSKTLGLKYEVSLSSSELKSQDTTENKDFSSLAASLIGKAFSRKKSPSPRGGEKKDVSPRVLDTPVADTIATPRRSPRSRAQVFSFDSATSLSELPATPTRPRRTSLNDSPSS